MSIFQPVLNDATRIAIVKVELDSIRYETGNVAAYKTNDTFCICMFGPQYMTNVSYTKHLQKVQDAIGLIALRSSRE